MLKSDVLILKMFFMYKGGRNTSFVFKFNKILKFNSFRISFLYGKKQIFPLFMENHFLAAAAHFSFHPGSPIFNDFVLPSGDSQIKLPH